MLILNGVINGQWKSNIPLDIGTSAWKWIAGILVGVVVAVGLVLLQFIPVIGQFLTASFVTVLVISVGAGVFVGKMVEKKFPDDFDLPIQTISPEEIFKNKIGAIDVNFFNPKEISEKRDSDGNIEFYYLDENNNGTYDSGDTKTTQSTAKVLRDNISRWYNAIKNIALVGLLSVLVYIGIRVILCSTANEKAKYKGMIKDWLVAICLVFMLHYIMAFSITIVEKITEGISTNDNGQIAVIANEKVAKSVFDNADKIAEIIAVDESEVKEMVSDDKKVVAWPSNYMGLARIEGQGLGDADDETVGTKAGWTIIYLVLIFFTVFFMVFYIKRVIYLAFLTLIAPLVALTYPIDKLSDGQAQGFNTWLKEYMYNLLIQPFHLLLYTLLISTAIEFATENLIYTCVALGFMMPAEKLLRKMFNFGKSETASPMSAAAAGALAGNAISKLGNLGKKAIGNGKHNKDGNNANNSETNNNLRTVDETSGYDNNDDLRRLGENQEDQEDLSDTDSNMSDTSAAGAALGGTIGAGAAASNERLEELKAEGFEEGDPEYDKAKAEYEKNLATLGRQTLERENMRQTDNELETDNATERDNSISGERSNRTNYDKIQDLAAKKRKQWEEKLKAGTVAQKLGGKIKTTANKIPRPIKGVANIPIKGVKNIGKAVFKRENIGKVLRGATKLGIGAIGLGLGGAIGIATGNLGSVGKYGLGGAVAGYSLGGGIGNLATKGGNFLTDSFREGYYGKNEYERIKAKNEIAKSDRVDKFVKQNYSGLSETETTKIKSKIADYQVDSGTENLQRIKNAMELSDNMVQNEGISQEQADSRSKSALFLGDEYSKKDLYDPKIINGMKQNLIEQLAGKYQKKGLSKGEARKRATMEAEEKVKQAEAIVQGRSYTPTRRIATKERTTSTIDSPTKPATKEKITPTIDSPTKPVGKKKRKS